MNERQRRAVPWVLFVAVQVAAVALYFILSDTVAVTVRHALYPVIWVTLSAWVFVRTPLPDELPWYAPVVAVVSGVYFLALLWLAGLVGTAESPGLAIDVTGASPGWGPVLAYSGDLVYLRIIPFQVVGYAALAYLVFVALTDTASSLVGAAVGLVSCVGCTWTLVAGALSVVGSAGVTAVVQSYSYELSTLVFVTAVVVLYRYAS
ncbi:MAG: hypothetical protein ACLFSW_03385 [Halobacteriales archaeon]